ncbi:hypothetical protein CXG81DRAFT_7540, partial [Caulochytrium protostelioides]
RRVVVTGLGAVTPLAASIDGTWRRLLRGDTGTIGLQGRVHRETGSDYTGLPVQVAATVPDAPDTAYGLFAEGDAHAARALEAADRWRPEAFMTASDLRTTTRFIQLAVGAAHQAVTDAGLAERLPSDRALGDRTGVCIGSGIGGLDAIVAASRAFDAKGLRALSPYFIPKILVNLAAGHVSIRYGLRGPNHAASTACTTGAHSLGDAARLIAHGDADVMVAGGTESSLCPLALGGFAKAKSLAVHANDAPATASRPFDVGRGGFVVGEGAGVVVLESLDHALRRGAPRIYAELAGYGLSGDAHHLTAPPESGAGAFAAMARALADAGPRPNRLGYVNAHATATGRGDVAESRAILSLLLAGAAPSAAAPLAMPSKGALGHLLGAAGAVEAIVAILALHHQILPPTANLREPDVAAGCVLDYVGAGGEGGRAVTGLDTVLTNSFGFGGNNASLCFTRLE